MQYLSLSKKFSGCTMGRAPCCEKNGLKKGPWTPEEDQKLIDYIQKNGYGNWRTLPQNAGLQRCGKSCRLRWTNYLRPDIKRGRFSFEEEETIIQLHSILGNKWSAIATRLPGRTDNEIKNFWNTHIRKRLLRMGIDPVTHSPRLDLLDLSSILSSSLYHPSQMNLSRLLGVQMNPELLRIASSLFSPHRENPNFLPQNVQENQLIRNLDQAQLPQLIQVNQIQTPIQDINPNCTTFSTPCVSFPSEAQIMESNLDQFSTNFSSFSPQSCLINEGDNNGMPSNLGEDYSAMQNYGFYGSENSNFQSNNLHNNFSFASMLSNLSTSSSSPPPVNSNAAYANYNSSTTSTNTEDERDSYCSNNMFKFEIQEMLGVNEFM